MGNPMYKTNHHLLKFSQAEKEKKTELNPKWSTELDQLLPTALHTPEVGSIW